MEDPNRTKFKNNFLYWGLFVYTVCLLFFSPANGGLDTIRIPSFSLLLLALIQIIFPQFRFSKTANIIAVILIIGIGILFSSPIAN